MRAARVSMVGVSMNVSMKLRLGGSAAGVAARIKLWAVERFGEGEEAWMVSETLCRVPGRAPRQTVLALMHPAASIAFRLPMPMAEVTQADVAALGETAARLAAEACC